MNVLEITNYYSHNLEQISISLDEGETMILLGSPGKKDIILGILSLQKGKMGEIILESGNKIAKSPAVVFGDDFFPGHISPEKWERLYSSFHADFCKKTYHSYLERLNVSKNVPVKEEWNAYKMALALALAQNPRILLIELPDIEKKEEKIAWNQVLRDCRRVIQEEAMAKIISAPSLSVLENWKLEGCQISIFAEKKLLCTMPYEDMELEKISCSFDHVKTIAPSDYLWKKPERDGVTVVRQKSEEKWGNEDKFTVYPCSLSEFMEILQEEKNDE